MEIKNSYLMWVGHEHYAGIKDYATEAVSHGISKRMPTPEMATKMMEPGTVVFLAHDEGEYRECSACFGEIECGECRKLDGQIEALTEEMDEEGVKPAKLARLKAQIAELSGRMKYCDLCDGKGVAKAGTGGRVVIDGEGWDYRRYNYWLHQPKRWSPAGKKVEALMCETCGGTGRMPEGKVFGLYIPSAIEWIMPAGTEAKVAEAMAARGFTIIPEAAIKAEVKRGCGYRHAGGAYAVTHAKGGEEKAKEVLKELVAKGIVKADSADISGSFIRFVTPVPIEAKRFRGISHFAYDTRLKAETEAIFDALDGAEG